MLCCVRSRTSQVCWTVKNESRRRGKGIQRWSRQVWRFLWLCLWIQKILMRVVMIIINNIIIIIINNNCFIIHTRVLINHIYDPFLLPFGLGHLRIVLVHFGLSLSLSLSLSLPLSIYLPISISLYLSLFLSILLNTRYKAENSITISPIKHGYDGAGTLYVLQ